MDVDGSRPPGLSFRLKLSISMSITLDRHELTGLSLTFPLSASTSTLVAHADPVTGGRSRRFTDHCLKKDSAIAQNSEEASFHD